MKIVVLDAHTLNPGDLTWQNLEKLGDVQVHERTAPEQTVGRCSGAEIVLTNKVFLGPSEMDDLPDLQYIGVLATGVNVVDLSAASARGIVVTNVPAYSTSSVAQQVFALLLELTRGAGYHAERVRSGAWSKSPDFCFWEKPQIELAGLTMGIIGFGRIGQAVARIARAFEMQVLIHTRSLRVAKTGVRSVALNTLLAESDVVSLHCPLTPETEGLINADRLILMKQKAYLINTGRGALVDEQALARVLTEGKLAGAGLDVLTKEPPDPDNPLVAAPRCIITPHIAWATHASRQRLMSIAVSNVESFLAGEPQNQVN